MGETEVQDLWHEPGSISFPRKFTKTRGSLCGDKEYIKSHSEVKIELVNSHFNKQLTVERYQYILNHGKLTVSFDSTCLFEQNPEHAADILKIPVKVRTSFFCKYELR